MFSSRELIHYNLPMCPYCIYEHGSSICSCKNKSCNFTPENWNAYIQLVINTLKLRTIPDKGSMLKRYAKRSPAGSVTDGDFTSDTYYCQLINDSLYLIRHHECAYVFSLSHIIDILKFEPDIDAHYIPSSNSFRIEKPQI